MGLLDVLAPVGIGLADKIFGGGDSGSAKQTTIQQPSARTAEGQEIWDAFMDNLLGEKVPNAPAASHPPRQFTPDPTMGVDDREFAERRFRNQQRQTTEDPGFTRRGGLQDLLGRQENWMRQPISEYQGTLTDLMNNRGVGEGLLNPLSFTIGGGSPVNITPRSNLQAIGLLSDLAGQKFQTSANYPKGWSEMKFLDYLQPLAMETEKYRYGIPSATETGNLKLPGPSFLDSLAGGFKIWDEAKELFG